MERLEVEIAKKVRSFRLVLGWSQSDLAVRLAWRGISMHQTTVAKLEAAERPIRVDEAGVLAELLGVPLGVLLGLADQQDPQVDLRLALANAEGEAQEAERRKASAEQRVESLRRRLGVRPGPAGSAPAGWPSADPAATR